MLTTQEHLHRAADTRQLRSGDQVLIERAVRGLEVLHRKWSVDLIVAMARGIRRPSRLHACLPGISKKVMTDCLRSLERDGLVARSIFAQVPVRVEYTLTPLGWTTTEAIVALSDWVEHHGSEVARARSEYGVRLTELDSTLRSSCAA